MDEELRSHGAASGLAGSAVQAGPTRDYGDVVLHSVHSGPDPGMSNGVLYGLHSMEDVQVSQRSQLRVTRVYSMKYYFLAPFTMIFKLL